MNFLEALNTKVADIEKPALMPVGTYVWAVNKPHKESVSKNGDWSTVEIPCVPKMPYDDAEDVDMDELSAYGDLKQGINSIRFMFPNDPDKDNERKRTLWNLRRFLLDTLKVEGDDDSTIKELLAKAIGAEFIAQAAHRQDPDRGETYCDVKNSSPLV
jgi:hypothetical protein